jgi:RNA polymerase sigma-70 factor (ECF subfamily)
VYLILLDQQDRSLWDTAARDAGGQAVKRALRSRAFGSFCVQAAIAALHAEAPSADETDWSEIVALYELLMQISPSPIVALNQAVASAMRDGPEAGITQVNALFTSGELTSYHLAHAAMADFYRQLGDASAAIASYQRALELTEQVPERRFLHGRIVELTETQ